MDVDAGIALPAADFQGPYPDELPGIAQSALRDNVWVRDGQSLTFTLNNLPANTVYNFLFYGAAGTTGDYSLWTVTGSNSGSDFIVPLVNNGTQVATVNGIIPNVSDEITVVMTSPGVGRWNLMQITETLPPVPEPATGALLGLGLLALNVRRRRAHGLQPLQG